MTSILPFTLALAGCLLLHALFDRRPDLDFQDAMKQSRGLVAIVLVALGTVALIRYWPLWRQGFLAHHDGDPFLTAVVYALCGHVVADLVWLAVGTRRGEKRRIDLEVHHLVGLLACVAGLLLDFGLAALTIACITEVLPIATAQIARARRRGDREGERRGLRASAWMCLGLRLPFWLFLLFGSARAFLVDAEPGWRWVFALAVALTATFATLDILWSRAFFRILRARGPRRAVA